MKVHSGRFKGFPIQVKTHIPIRPTTEKIREWIFQILEPYISESRFLDLFAGSGIMGIEALSRGSQFAVFVDRHTGALIRKNLLSFGQKLPSKVYSEDVLRFLRRRHATHFRFHVINADPPYNFGQYSQMVSAIGQSKLLEEEGFFVLERGKHTTFSITQSPLSVLREKRFGETLVTIFKKGIA